MKTKSLKLMIIVATSLWVAIVAGYAAQMKSSGKFGAGLMSDGDMCDCTCSSGSGSGSGDAE